MISLLAIQKQTPTLVPFSCLIQLRAIDLAYNRRDSAKCDLVLDDTKTNANSSSIFVFESSCALLIWPIIDAILQNVISFWYDTKTNANSSTIFVFESSCALLIWPIIDAILRNVISFWTIQKQTPTLVPFSCLNQVACYWFGLNRRDSAKCDLVLDDTNTNANSSTILVFNIQLSAIDLAYNRRDSTKCDLVLNDTKTNANSSSILVYESRFRAIDLA